MRFLVSIAQSIGTTLDTFGSNHYWSPQNVTHGAFECPVPGLEPEQDTVDPWFLLLSLNVVGHDQGTMNQLKYGQSNAKI
jgi:hypothetical protein